MNGRWRSFALCALLSVSAATSGQLVHAQERTLTFDDLLGTWQDDNGKTFTIERRDYGLVLKTKLNDWRELPLQNVRNGSVTFERKPTANELRNLTPDPGKAPPTETVVSQALADSEVMQYFDGMASRDPNDRYLLTMDVAFTGDHLVYDNPKGQLLSVDHPKTPLDRYKKRLGFVVVTPSNLDGSNVNDRDIGGLDFGSNQTRTTRVRPMTLKNGGEGTLHVVDISANGSFAVDGRSNRCRRVALKPGQTCQFNVEFSPTSASEKTGEAFIEDDSPDSPEAVSLRGTGTEESVSPSQAESREAGSGYSATLCTNDHSLVPGITVGWAPLQRTPQTVVAQVVEGHVASQDMVDTTSLGSKYHETSDFDVFVYPDQGYRHFIQPGNFAVGADFTPSEKGRLTVENETYADSGHPGLPPFVWPTTGDKIKVKGIQIFDCGHQYKGSYRAEIHPLEFIATYRDAALTAGASTSGLGSVDPHDGAMATRVDAWASAYAGPTYGIQFNQPGAEWFAQTSGSYEFDVLAPPKPSPTATLARPVVDPANVGSANCESIATLNNRGYRFRLTPNGPQGRAYGGCTVYVEWQDAKRPDSVKAKTRTYTVTLRELHVINPLTEGRWGLYASVNEAQTFSLLTGETNTLRQNYLHVDAGKDVLLGTSFPVTVVDGQDLHVEFRIPSWIHAPTIWMSRHKKITVVTGVFVGEPIGAGHIGGVLAGILVNGDWGMSEFAGTVGEQLDAAALSGLSGVLVRHATGSSQLPNRIGADELDELCNPCYELVYSIQ